jgi:HPt (histidine-containing phosphotransfer) domain-containing protein
MRDDVTKMRDDDGLEALVARSQRQFMTEFPTDFGQVTALVDAAGRGDGRALVDLRHAAHRLVGRAGILQFLDLARHAAALETVARVDEVRHFDRGAAAACLVALCDAFVVLRGAVAPLTPSSDSSD